MKHLLISIPIAQITTHGQDITQAYMGDYISLRAHNHKGNHGYISVRPHDHKRNYGYMSLKCYDNIKRE